MNTRSNVVSERFWSKVNVSESLRCWEWRGVRDDNGYGKFRMEGRTIRAPRVAYWLRNGSWPDNACHSCDVPSCCNPDHIFNGTRSDNMLDMYKKRRHKIRYGESHGASVLTDEKVKAMRSEYKLGKVSILGLAKKHGCSFSSAQRVISKATWRHLL